MACITNELCVWSVQSVAMFTRYLLVIFGWYEFICVCEDNRVLRKHEQNI